MIYYLYILEVFGKNWTKYKKAAANDNISESIINIKRDFNYEIS